MRVQYCLYSLAECTLASFLNPPYYLALTVILFTELPPKSRNQRFLDIEWVRYDMNIEQGDMFKESKERNKAERNVEEFDMV